MVYNLHTKQYQILTNFTEAPRSTVYRFKLRLLHLQSYLISDKEPRVEEGRENQDAKFQCLWNQMQDVKHPPVPQRLSDFIIPTTLLIGRMSFKFKN